MVILVSESLSFVAALLLVLIGAWIATKALIFSAVLLFWNIYLLWTLSMGSGTYPRVRVFMIAPLEARISPAQAVHPLPSLLRLRDHFGLQLFIPSLVVVVIVSVSLRFMVAFLLITLAVLFAQLSLMNPFAPISLRRLSGSTLVDSMFPTRI